MNEKPYSELLKDPRWQRKRLKLLEANKWHCEECSNGQHELHVHHGSYLPDQNPWDYPDDLMHCLCRDCHSEYHLVSKSVKTLLGKLSLTQLWGILKLLNDLVGRSHFELGISMGIIGDEIINKTPREMRESGQ